MPNILRLPDPIIGVSITGRSTFVSTGFAVYRVIFRNGSPRRFKRIKVTSPIAFTPLIPTGSHGYIENLTLPLEYTC